jgi:hypothetical protein
LEWIKAINDGRGYNGVAEGRENALNPKNQLFCFSRPHMCTCKSLG